MPLQQTHGELKFVPEMPQDDALSNETDRYATGRIRNTRENASELSARSWWAV